MTKCLHPPNWSCRQRRLANCDWMPASYTSGQPSYPRWHPTYWASSQSSHIFFSMLCHGAWTPAPLSAHRSTERKWTASQIETPICARHTAAHQFIWQQHQKCGALGGSPMECGVVGQHYETPHIQPRHRHLPSWMTLPRTAWVRLNRLCTVVGCFRSCLHRWSMALSATCEYGAEEQTVDHFVFECPFHWPLHCLHGLTVLNDKTVEWVLNTCPEI